MFLQKKYNWLYILLLIFSTLYILFMNSFYSMWVMMELNVMVFLTYLSLNQLFVNNNVMKYYLLNSFSSLIFLFFMNFLMLKMNYLNLFVLNMLMLMKLGMFPFHLWFIDMMINLSWMNCFILAGWQKLIPMVFLMNIYVEKLMILMLILGGMFSLMMGFNQIILKKLMGYSSINHMAWMLMSLMLSKFVFFIYYMIYLFMNYVFMSLFSFMDLDNMNDLYLINLSSNFNSYYMFFFMSMSGLPPFFGFFMKLFILNYFEMNMQLIILFVLLFFSLVFMFYYLRMIFNFMMMLSYNININFLKLNFKLLNNFMIFFLMLMVLFNLSFMIWMFY